jgi:hypothetical protein
MTKARDIADRKLDDTNLTFGDNDKAIFGAGSDLQIYHDGGNSRITDTGTGSLVIQANQLLVKNADSTETLATFNQDSDVILRYNNASKLATTSTGIDVTGTATMDGLTVDGDVTISDAIPVLTLSSTSDSYASLSYNSNSIQKGLITYNAFDDALVMSHKEAGTTSSIRGISIKEGDISFYEDTGTTAKFFWDASAESLGIGTSSPSTKLQVEDSGNVAIKATKSTVSSISLDVGTTENAIIWDGSRDLKFMGGSSGTAERMRIDSSGNVGIGSVFGSETIDSTLHVAASTAEIRIEDTNNGTGGTSYTPKLTFDANGTEVGSLGYTGGNLNLFTKNYNSSAIRFGTADTERMRIDSSGNVGIGVTNPDTPLVVANGMKTVVSDSGIHNAVRMDNSYAAGITAGAAITWQQGGNIKSSIEANTYGSDYMSFKVASNVERMKIDAAGRVTMPYQPAFKAYLGADQAFSEGTGNVLVGHNYTVFNRGNCFNTSTHRFTAPVDGVYFFYGSAILEAFGSNISYRITSKIMLNGAENKSSLASGQSANEVHDDNEVQISGYVPMSAGDYVEMWISVIGTDGNGNIWGSTSSSPWTSFSGHLVG